MVKRKAPTSSRPLIRMTEKSYGVLKDLSETSGRSMTDLAGEAIERLRREHFIAEAHAAYRASPRHRDELKVWDRTLRDGLPKD